MSKSNPFSPQEYHELNRETPVQLSPEDLPEIRMIDVLILDGNGALGGMNTLDNAIHKRVGNQVAQEIANLFRQLPSGEPARCHTPPFGLRFYTEDGLQRQCSICWECNNIYGDFRYDFDADHSISQKLLALLIQLAK